MARRLTFLLTWDDESCHLLAYADLRWGKVSVPPPAWVERAKTLAIVGGYARDISSRYNRPTFEVTFETDENHALTAFL